MAIETFDAASSSLQAGINLIEASAGTGKTYAIAMLALRFVVERELDIKSLLVVTFTKAATEELKERIRSRLAEAKQALYRTDAEADPNLRQWLENLTLDRESIRQRLELALLDIDQAAIFTIHGFCQRVLGEHALESGQMFDCKLSGDIAALRQNCADDFWRQQLYRRPAWQAALLTAVFPTPDALLASLGHLNLKQTVYPEADDVDAALAELETLIAKAKAEIGRISARLQACFEDGYFNKSYSDGFAEKSRALQDWLQDQTNALADVELLTESGILAGLNGNRLRGDKKLRYFQELEIDTASFENLAAALKRLPVIFRCALLQALREQLDKALQQDNVLSFDDLITRLAEALQDGHGKQLIAELRQRFGVALIDEFQDTDQPQWHIFSQLFGAADQFLYLIGDPKQAIYKFRGADIYSYFAAQSRAQQYYTLSHNWRSHPDLVVGVNRLFARNAPFLFDNLAFLPVRAGRCQDDGYIGGAAPLVVWQLEAYSEKQPYWTARQGNNGEAATCIRAAIVNEIVALLNGAEIQTGQQHRKLKPKDIAILVRSNGQAVDYQAALHAAGIPAVLNSKQSVFATPEALELHTVLQAVAQPGHLQALKQALTVSWFDFDGRQLYRLFNEDSGLDAWLSRFQEYQQIWQQDGLLAMMQRLLQQENVEANLGNRPQAERRLTNLRHIVERLQQASIDERLAINKTLDWLRHAIQQAPFNAADDQQLRLESDEEAVKIVTLHSSKGLEYPVVFCPGLWQRSERLKNERHLIQCHEAGTMIADLGSEQFNERRERALYEELAEDLRLVYVALTRAKYRCYLAWADVRTKDKCNDSALAYLLDLAGGDFAAQRQILQALAAELPQAIQYRLLTRDLAAEVRYQADTGPGPLNCRHRQRSLSSRWQMSSYTALSALSLHDAPELPEDKAVETAHGEDALPVEASTNIWEGLPKGAQSGNVIHSLLETNSFRQLATGNDLGRPRDQTLQRYGLSLEEPSLVDRLLQTVVSTPLDENGDFRLRDLDDRHCLKEMAFYLAIQDMDAARINTILAASPAYQALSHKAMRGYLTGFIDLICEYQGRYYVMDYKTNSLPDYRPENLLAAMREHNYGLQYWLYSLVLDRYLRQRLTDYRYQRHFGGVKYLFVRGMAVETPGCGVFSDLPDAGTLEALAGVFCAE